MLCTSRTGTALYGHSRTILNRRKCVEHDDELKGPEGEGTEATGEAEKEGELQKLPRGAARDVGGRTTRRRASCKTRFHSFIQTVAFPEPVFDEFIWRGQVEQVPQKF